MKVDLHQGSVLSPLLFSVVMDVVSSEERSGLHSKLLYADDLVLNIYIADIPPPRALVQVMVYADDKSQK